MDKYPKVDYQVWSRQRIKQIKRQKKVRRDQTNSCLNIKNYNVLVEKGSQAGSSFLQDCNLDLVKIEARKPKTQQRKQRMAYTR